MKKGKIKSNEKQLRAEHFNKFVKNIDDSLKSWI